MTFFKPKGLSDLVDPLIPVGGGLDMQPVADERFTGAEPAKPGHCLAD